MCTVEQPWKRHRLGGTVEFSELTDSEKEHLTFDLQREMDLREIAEAKLRGYDDAFEVLNRVAKTLATEYNLEKIIQTVTDGGREITKAAYGAFFYSTGKERNDAFMSYSLSGVPREVFSELAVPRKNDLFTPGFEGQDVRRFADIRQKPESDKQVTYHWMFPGRLPIRSYLSVPVISRSGTVMGGIFYGHPEAGVFTEYSERMLVNLASQAAVAIDNANMYAALQMDLDQREIREEAARKLAAIVTSSNDAIISKNLNSIVTSWNKSAERIFGYTAEEMIGKPITLLIPENHIDEEPKILDRIRRGESINHYQTVRRRKDGSIIDISLTVSPLIDSEGNVVGASKIVRDITDLKDTQEQLRQAQKMEAVGRLAGGIAHDFNNLLTSINGFTELAQSEVDPGSLVAEYLDEIRKSGERAATLTQQLLAYSRKQILQPKIINLNDTLSELQRMLPRLIREDIVFKTVLEPGLPLIKADPNQIQQIIMNMALNARDAMPNGGSLILKTSGIVIDQESGQSLEGTAKGLNVLLEISDTGVGMPPEIQARIFEPFFTTKEVGKGTGLGLSSVYGIVKQSGGSITVDSKPGEGTTFRILFPIDIEGSLPTADVLGDAGPDPAPQSETVLLAEDEPSVRKFLVATLSKMGFIVVEAEDGAHALALGTKLAKVDLLLTDLVMPNMNGGQLSQALKAHHPFMKMLFMSGYTKDILSVNAAKDPDSRFLQKPFSQVDLARKVREILSVPAP